MRTHPPFPVSSDTLTLNKILVASGNRATANFEHWYRVFGLSMTKRGELILHGVIVCFVCR